MKMIYKRIRDLREDNDMTQAQVGEKMFRREPMPIMKQASV